MNSYLFFWTKYSQKIKIYSVIMDDYFETIDEEVKSFIGHSDIYL